MRMFLDAFVVNKVILIIISKKISSLGLLRIGLSDSHLSCTLVKLAKVKLRFKELCPTSNLVSKVTKVKLIIRKVCSCTKEQEIKYKVKTTGKAIKKH